MVLKLSQICICLPFDEYIALVSAKSYSAFPWISAQPLLEPLMNMHTTSYMSVIPAIHETNALREDLWQRVGKFLLKSTIALWASKHEGNISFWGVFRPLPVGGAFLNLYTFHGLVLVVLVVLVVVKIPSGETVCDDDSYYAPHEY